MNDEEARLTRRRILELATTAAWAGVTVPLWSRLAWARSRIMAAPAGPKPRAQSCVLLYMEGGPSQIDTFDPKPGRPTGGPFKAVESAVPGIRISEHLPRLGRQMKRLCLVRSLTSKEGNHDRARYLLHTGYAPNPTVRHPSLGGWVILRKGSSYPWTTKRFAGVSSRNASGALTCG